MKEELAKFKEAFPLFETERLHLRGIQPSDNAALFSIMSDPEVTRYYNSFPMTTENQADETIRKLEHHFSIGFGIRWAIELKNESRFIGTIGFRGGEQNPFAAEMGYEIGKNWWGKGFTAEAITPLLKFGFSELKLERIEAQVVNGNTASQRVLEKCNFAYEGLLRKKGYWKNDLQDLHYYSIFKNDIQSA